MTIGYSEIWSVVGAHLMSSLEYRLDASDVSSRSSKRHIAYAIASCAHTTHTLHLAQHEPTAQRPNDIMASQRAIPFMVAAGVGKFIFSSREHCDLNPASWAAAAAPAAPAEEAIFLKWLTPGVIGGVYIWNQPLQELSGKGGPTGDIKDGRSQTVKDGKDTPTPMRHGGAQHNDLTPSNVAGTTPDATKSNSGGCCVQCRARFPRDMEVSS